MWKEGEVLKVSFLPSDLMSKMLSNRQVGPHIVSPTLKGTVKLIPPYILNSILN